MVSVYVAGPQGFTEPGRRWHDEVLLPALRAAGLDPLDPWAHPEDPIGTALAITDPVERHRALRVANAAVGGRNADLIEAAVGVLAMLDGTDVDSGTAAEIGYAAARGLPVVGLRTDVRPGGDNEAAAVNLQVQWFVERHGGRVVSRLDDAVQLLASLVRGQ
ncbi:MAG: nucleoside 2-deoxyribosyltransferase [Acidimicrobiales bacterium]|jgi:nucleoside 2-deoxyribosyltransferase|nr:nucleoside 2-deoxyribosyltransferase [Acidimicrobiales bacterium]